MTRSLSLLVGGSLAFWLVVVYPAHLLWGDSAVRFSATAGLLCLVPTVVTLAWSQKALKGLPEQQLLAVMGGIVVRMGFVIGAGMALHTLHPAFHYDRFLIWVIVFYLATLALEMGILLGVRAPCGRG